jgi:hypothetical protein
MADELGISKETICQILHENLRKREHLSKVRPTHTLRREEETETHKTSSRLV